MINIDELKKKIIYRSNYRGTKEMDKLLGAFTKKYINHLNENDIIVPIGLNVEHIMSYNFQASIEMLQELSRIYREFCIKTEIY